jgi:ADP-ribose pyrophosphatase YjhB (NUDIX family)
MALLQKVAVLVTRPGPDGPELLVFEHADEPAGVQVPAGTVEPGEDVRAAAIRELHEETGVVVDDVELLWVQDEVLERGRALVTEHVPLRAAPDPGAEILSEAVWRLGVRVIEICGAWAHIALDEFDLTVVPYEVVSSTEGWVQAAVLERSQVRHVFHAIAPRDVADRWEVFAEGMYTFRCSWAPLDDPGLVSMQQMWVDRALPLLTAREA